MSEPNPVETLQAFLNQFGPLQKTDQIILDYIFELMYHSKGKYDLSLSDEEKQEGSQVTSSLEFETTNTGC